MEKIFGSHYIEMLFNFWATCIQYWQLYPFCENWIYSAKVPLSTDLFRTLTPCTRDISRPVFSIYNEIIPLFTENVGEYGEIRPPKGGTKNSRIQSC